jgi:hypothetical protein
MRIRGQRPCSSNEIGPETGSRRAALLEQMVKPVTQRLRVKAKDPRGLERGTAAQCFSHAKFVNGGLLLEPRFVSVLETVLDPGQ